MNKNTGELFCCTLVSSGANEWTNIGDGTGKISPYTGTIEYLVLGGGGGGGGKYGGGGGAGGYRTNYGGTAITISYYLFTATLT